MPFEERISIFVQVIETGPDKYDPRGKEKQVGECPYEGGEVAGRSVRHDLVHKRGQGQPEKASE